jgi:hypothetical protein
MKHTRTANEESVTVDFVLRHVRVESLNLVHRFFALASTYGSLYLRILDIGFAFIRKQVVDLLACSWKVPLQALELYEQIEILMGI